jgi:two-component system sensor histidine kinase AlgZ
MALQARIQPHFLFNSLNSVLSLVRDEPRRAEAMLEDLSDLLRALLADNRALVPLSQELALARAYLDIEGVRFGQRLRVRWQCEFAPLDALVPPLVLQPLVENAVRHGVEPWEAGADITIEAYDDAGWLALFVRNTVAEGAVSRQTKGNHIALENIRERLDLHFDAEAQLRTYQSSAGEFVAQLRLPIRRASQVRRPPLRTT